METVSSFFDNLQTNINLAIRKSHHIYKPATTGGRLSQLVRLQAP